MAHNDLIRRFAAFNIVGAAGVALQLATLAVLVRVFEWHYLPATAAAVEVAILNNFMWHQRWTWKDRPSATRQSSALRLVRFHALNGAISFAGNLLLMTLFTGALRLDPIAANGIAILACSLVNFAASERLVFRDGRGAWRASRGLQRAFFARWGGRRDDREYREYLREEQRSPGSPPRVLCAVGWSPRGCIARRTGSPTRQPRWGPRMQPDFHHGLLGLLILLGIPQAAAAGQDASTIAAWHSYEAAIDARYNAASDTGGPFFVLDRERVNGWRETVVPGATRMLKIEVPSVPDGKIHHWVGAVFVPGVTLETVLERLKRNAGRESESYEDVIASKLLARDGDRVSIFMKLRRTKVITVTYNTEHTVAFRKIGASRASARSVATRIAELEQPGTPKEREKTAAEDSGYLWRLNAYWRYEAVPGGVLVECESVSLSRTVPWWAPFIRPLVDGVARDSLERTLRSLRAVLVKPGAAAVR